MKGDFNIFDLLIYAGVAVVTLLFYLILVAINKKFDLYYLDLFLKVFDGEESLKTTILMAIVLFIVASINPVMFLYLLICCFVVIGFEMKNINDALFTNKPKVKTDYTPFVIIVFVGLFFIGVLSMEFK